MKESTMEKDHSNAKNAIKPLLHLATRKTMKEDIRKINHTNALFVPRAISEDIC
jgi:hypothetical protein